jgi:nucleoid DNA-binding protein
MNTKGLTRVISLKFGLSKALSGAILKTILQTITSELKSGRLVRLRNFGTFTARKSHGKLRAKFDDSKNFFKQ